MAMVCETCGDEGFGEALVYCDSCKLGAVHRYCCGIMPVPIDDYVTWFCDECDTASDCVEVQHQDTSNVEVSSSPPMEEPETATREVPGSSKSNESTGLQGTEASVLEKSENEKKEKRKIITHPLPDDAIVDIMEVSKKQGGSENGESNDLTGLVRNEISVLEKTEEKKKKKDVESSNHFSPVLEVSSSPPVIQTMEEPETTIEIPGSTKPNESTGLLGSGASVSEAGDGASVLQMSEKKKKKKKKRKIITHSLPDSPIVETMEVSKKQDGSENGESDELISLLRKKKKKKKKKKTDKGEEKNEESSSNFSPVLEAEGHGVQATTSVEPMKESKKRKCSDSRESEELNVSVRDETLVLEENEKKTRKKKKKKSSTHTLPVLDALQDVVTSVEAIKESTIQKCSESRESKEMNVLVGNEVSVLEKSPKKKKKKRNEESSTHTLPVLDSLQDVTTVEAMKDSTIQKCSESRESKQLNVVVGDEVSVLEKSAKRKKKKKKTDKGEEKNDEESSNHILPVLKDVDSVHQDTTSVEATNESKKHKTSESREFDEVIFTVRNEISVPKKSEKKKKTNEESSSHTAPVLAAKNHVPYDTDNVESAKAQESSASRKPDELAGLEKNGASVSEGGNSTNVPDHNSCTTSKMRRPSSRKIHVTSETVESPAKNSSCKEAESNKVMTARNFNSLALNNGRAQPIRVPIWRGSLSVKQGNICSIDGLDGHLSTLACHKVYEKAGLLHTRLSAEMFPRLDIWPPSFLKNGPPTDNDIALYFFPSPDSNGEKVYYSLVDEMKKNDLAMRYLLDDVELLIFTSYQLPLPFWKFNSKEYLWGIFRRRKILRQ